MSSIVVIRALVPSNAQPQVWIPVTRNPTHSPGPKTRFGPKKIHSPQSQSIDGGIDNNVVTDTAASDLTATVANGAAGRATSPLSL